METVQVPPQRIPKKAGGAIPWKWIAVVAFVLLAIGALVLRLAIARAEPILRARVIETLTNRFNSKVELASFHVSVVNGIEVWGEA